MKKLVVQKGFTLVEIIVVLAIIAILAGIVSTFLIQILIGSVKTNIVVESKETGERILSFMEKKIIGSNRATVAPGNLGLNYPNNTLVSFNCISPGPGSNGSIQFIDTRGTISYLSNRDPQTGVNIIECQFTELKKEPTQTIEVYFKIKESIQAPIIRPFYQAKGTSGVDFRQTFTLRSSQ